MAMCFIVSMRKSVNPSLIKRSYMANIFIRKNQFRATQNDGVCLFSQQNSPKCNRLLEQKTHWAILRKKQLASLLDKHRVVVARAMENMESEQ